MKNLVLIIFAALFTFVSCTDKKQPAEKFNVFVSISDFDGNQVKVQRRVDDAWVTVDSALVEAGMVKLSGEIQGQEMLFLSLQDVRGNVPFFAEAAEITVKVDPNNLRSPEITGSAAHQRYLDFMNEFDKYDEILFQHYQAYRAADEDGDTTAKSVANSAYELAEKEKKQFLVNYIMQNNSDVVSHYILFRNSYQFELDELESMVVNFDTEKKSSYLDGLMDRVLVLKSVAVGMPFKDFEQGNQNDEPIKLSSKVGTKLLLVDFWASWCAPCRVENPNIVAVYNDYKDKGFDVYGVSFDTNKDKWLEAIAADKLTWTHVSDLKGWGNEAGKLYGVQSIPHSVLLDENGTIVAKNLREEALREKVAELLK
ncbi:MAG: TlpA disulfide reductase family protein [Bacteroidales bacterium]|nr:TlpA disulfide reductase family protein [Bacteroidales bacterium]